MALEFQDIGTMILFSTNTLQNENSFNGVKANILKTLDEIQCNEAIMNILGSNESVCLKIYTVHVTVGSKRCCLLYYIMIQAMQQRGSLSIDVF